MAVSKSVLLVCLAMQFIIAAFNVQTAEAYWPFSSESSQKSDIKESILGFFKDLYDGKEPETPAKSSGYGHHEDTKGLPGEYEITTARATTTEKVIGYEHHGHSKDLPGGYEATTAAVTTTEKATGYDK
ncbi:uncharacterized protein [Eurosta solidaginis]|uniref:uncharacterized protein n=1 Tax=Eurosta solidaginis TaxID=178769 RepID=UPI0035314967